MKHRPFLTVLLSCLAVSAFIVAAEGTSQAKEFKSHQKKSVRQTHKKLRHRFAKRGAVSKKMSAAKRQQHDALVAKLKEQEQQEKLQTAASQGSLQAAILKTAPGKISPHENRQRAAASAPPEAPRLAGSSVSKQAATEADVDTLYPNFRSKNDMLPTATEDQLDKPYEF